MFAVHTYTSVCAWLVEILTVNIQIMKLACKKNQIQNSKAWTTKVVQQWINGYKDWDHWEIHLLMTWTTAEHQRVTSFPSVFILIRKLSTWFQFVQESNKFSLKNRKDLGTAHHTPPLKKSKKQVEKPLPSLSLIPCKCRIEEWDGTEAG